MIDKNSDISLCKTCEMDNKSCHPDMKQVGRCGVVYCSSYTNKQLALNKLFNKIGDSCDKNF